MPRNPRAVEFDQRKEEKVIEQLVHWADQETLVRVVLLTSSRAIPQARTDAFSDYDVILVFRSIQRFCADRTKARQASM